MSKNTNSIAEQVRTISNKLFRASRKVRWNAFGLGKADRRDPAALTFARLGLLAYRW